MLFNEISIEEIAEIRGDERYEEGLEQGIEKGLEQGREQGREEILNLLDPLIVDEIRQRLQDKNR